VSWVPNVDMYLWRPIISEPPLCQLCQLEDGTYNINDLVDMHEVLDAKAEVNRREQAKNGK